MIFSIINSLLVFSVAIFLSFYLAKDKNVLPLISWSMLAIALIYGIGSLIVFDATNSGTNYYRSYMVFNRIDYWPVHGLLVLVLIASIILGWKTPIFKKSYFEKLSNLSFNINDNKIFIVACLLLVLGFILRLLYVKAFGGFLGYLDFNRAMRSGIFEIKNPYGFLQPFGYLVVLSSYFFWGLWLQKFKVFFTSIGLFVSVVFSLYIYYSFSGRVGFALYIAGLALAFLYIRSVSPRVVLTLALIGFPFVSFFLYFISSYFGLKGADSLSDYFVKEVSFVYTSFLVQLTEGDLYRFFIDFIMAPIYFLPSSWTMGLYESATTSNTILISGAQKGEQGVTGGIPVDLLTLGIMQVNVFGVFPVGFIFGCFIKRLDYFLNLIPNNKIRSVIMSYVSLRIAFIGLLYAHPEHFISGLFPIVLLLIIMLIVNYHKWIVIKFR